MAMKDAKLPLESVAASVSVLHAGPRENGGDAGTPTMEGKKKGRAKEESESEPSSSMKLGLGICGENAVAKHRKPLFTAAQLHELQLQALIFKYIAAGLPVPPGLLLPIWKTRCSSSGSTGGDIFRQLASLVQCSPWVFGLMDPEPWRCKRTDGKKWRCGQKVVPDQKYCERHMHRGRKRSRKLVEASQTAATAVDTTPSKDASENLEKPTPKVSNLNPISSQLKSHKEPTISREIVKNISNASKINVNSLDTGNGNGGYTNSAWSKNTLHRTSNRSDDKNGTSDTSPGLDFSPKSVLQVQACRTPCFHRIDEELEPGRCRRTDGKKWRCWKDVLPKQKYCATHMHRGTRKHVEASQSFVSPASTHNISSDAHGRPNAPNHRLDIKNSNKKFSISMSTSPKIMVNDDTDTASMSSDKTISDAIAANCETGSLSS